MFYVVTLAALKMCIALIVLTPLFGKKRGDLFEPLEGRTRLTSLLKFLNKAHAPFVIALVYLLLGNSPLLALVMLAVMMLVGHLIKKTGLVGQCNCYGELAVAGSTRQVGLDLLLVTMILVSLVIISFSQNVSRTTNAPTTPLFLLSLAFAAILAEGGAVMTLIMRVMPGWKGATGELTVGPGEASVYTRDMSVGELENGETIRLGQIADTCPMILFVGVSSNCPACAVLKPILLRIAEVFGENLRTVFLVEGTVNHDETIRNTLMLRSDAEFLALAGEGKFPFGLVVNSATLQPAGAVEYGENIGTLLLRVLSVATKPRKAA